MDLKSSALVLIEFQGEWLNEDGKIHFLMKDNKEFLARAVENGKQALSAARRYGMKVVHGGLQYKEGYLELGKGKYGLREHLTSFNTFLESEKGSQFIDPFIPQGNEFVLRGRTGASCFVGTNLDIFLRNQKIADIYLAGFALHVSVESTLRHGHDLGYNVILLEDACAGFSESQRKHVLEDVVYHFGKRMTVAEFISELPSK